MKILNISKSFGDKKVLENINLTFAAGEVTCIMGASGSGKTTLLNILAGLMPPDSGDVIWDSTSKKISMVFQEDRLLSWETALNNVLFVTNPARNYIEQAKKLLSEAGLGDSINKKAAKLSGGMKRRVAICRALIADYDLLILDEPFKGLDAKIKPVIMNMIKARIDANKYVLCVTHDASEVEYLKGRLVKLL